MSDGAGQAAKVKSGVLSAATAIASLTWNPFDTADKGMLIRLDAELRAELLPPSDGLQLCRQECEYLHHILGLDGVLTLSGGIDTDQDADFTDDDDLVGADVADGTGNYTGDLIKFVLKGDVEDAVIPLSDAGGELEDFGFVFRLEIPRPARRVRRALPMAVPRAPATLLPRIELGRSRRSSVCPIDLMILVDRSNSIKTNCKLGSGLLCWKKMKDFLIDLVGHLNVGTGPNDARYVHGGNNDVTTSRLASV